MNSSGIDVNMSETRKRFDSFYKWSKTAIDKEFDTALWRHINISETRAVFSLLDKLDDRSYTVLDAGCGEGVLSKS